MKRLIRFIFLVLAPVALTVSTAAFAQTPPATPAAAPTKFVPPVRGQADLGLLKPQTKRVKDEVVTTIKVKNLSLGSIAGLKVAEFWYDKAGNPVTGSEDRLKKPLLPNEVTTITLHTPFNPKMDRNNYTFTHANGTIKTKLLTVIN